MVVGFFFFKITVTLTYRYLWKNTRIFTNVFMLEMCFNWLHETKGLRSPGINNDFATNDGFLAGVFCRAWVSEPLRGWSPGREKPGTAESRRGRGRAREGPWALSSGMRQLKPPCASQASSVTPRWPGQQSGWSSGREGCCQAVPGAPGSPEEGPPNRISFCSLEDALETASCQGSGAVLLFCRRATLEC